MGSGAALEVPFNVAHLISPHEAQHPVWSNVDLGEFMMDNDLDFLGRMFNFNQPHDAAI